MTPIRRHISGPLPKKGLGSVLALSRTFDADLLFYICLGTWHLCTPSKGIYLLTLQHIPFHLVIHCNAWCAENNRLSNISFIPCNNALCSSNDASSSRREYRDLGRGGTRFSLRIKGLASAALPTLKTFGSMELRSRGRGYE